MWKVVKRFIQRKGTKNKPCNVSWIIGFKLLELQNENTLFW